MIYLFGDYGLYNQNPGIYGIRKVFDKMKTPCQIITPTMDVKHQENKTLQVSGFSPDSLWSIYDCFTGRLSLDSRELTAETYIAPKGYKPVSGPGSRQYISGNNRKIELSVGLDGILEAVTFYEGDDITQRELYDDRGHLAVVEYPLGEEDVHTKILDPDGQIIFELYQSGKYRQIVKVRYLPDEQDFLSESAFFKWAFEQLVAIRKPGDKFIIISDSFRQAIETATFDRDRIYLASTAELDDQEFYRDVTLDHYEAIIFNRQFDLAQWGDRFENRTDTRMVWNNFLPSDKLAPDFQVASYPIYLNLGKESEAVDFDEVIDFVAELLRTDDKISLTIEFSLLRNQVDLMKKLELLEIPDLKDRVLPLNRPWASKIEEEMARSIAYVHYQNSQVLSLPLSIALSSEKPILGLPADPLLSDYLNENNGQLISASSASRVIKQAVYDIDYVKKIAPNPGMTRKEFSTSATMARWEQIFSNNKNRSSV